LGLKTTLKRPSLMKASLTLNKSNTLADGTSPIVVVIRDKKKRKKLNIGYCRPEHWNSETNLPLRLADNFNQLMPIVLDYKSKIATANLHDYSFDEAVSLIIQPKAEPVEAMLLWFIDVMIEEKAVKNRPNRDYKGLKTMLQNYLNGNDTPINAITYEWLNDFVNYKLQNGCNEGGVMSYLRSLRAIYKEAQRRTSLNVNTGNPFLGIIKTPNSKPVIELSNKELKTLFAAQPKISRETDKFKILRNIAIFEFQFLIGGHDFIDIALLKWTDIKNNRIIFKRHKNRYKKQGGAQIDNLLLQKATEIIEIYGNQKSDRIFSHIPCPIEQPKKYAYYIRQYSRSLKNVCENINIPVVKTKSPRYLFRTRAGNLLIHDLVIMSLQGHLPQGVTFSYQGRISNKIKDSALKKICKL
jgi:site-specific recombinase XerD